MIPSLNNFQSWSLLTRWRQILYSQGLAYIPTNSHVQCQLVEEDHLNFHPETPFQTVQVCILNGKNRLNKYVKQPPHIITENWMFSGIKSTKKIWLSFNLTLFGMGLKIYVKWGGVCHHPLLNTHNHCEKPKIFFAFQIGHIEIGKVMKFGVILRVLELIFSSQIGLRSE